MTWDAEYAATLIGKWIVVGFNRLTLDGKILWQGARHGTITSVDAEHGIQVEEANGERFCVPPALHGLIPGRPRTYTLEPSQEEVFHPDFEMGWNVWGYGTPEEWWEVLFPPEDRP